MTEHSLDPISTLVITVLIPAAVSVIVGALAGLGATWRQREKLKHDFELQRERMRTELKLEFATETAIRDLLLDDRFEEQKRTFETIKARLGGFDDKELRMHLIRAGAVSFKRKSDGAELWGLRERVDAREVAGDEREGE